MESLSKKKKSLRRLTGDQNGTPGLHNMEGRQHEGKQVEG